ncbi:hypothetical protein NC651_037553 [Populus alba x Populus x berolinensis]|nr:hypothetical protein NC651_037553 [Populus alba x Populus x berolinensis]
MKTSGKFGYLQNSKKAIYEGPGMVLFNWDVSDEDPCSCSGISSSFVRDHKHIQDWIVFSALSHTECLAVSASLSQNVGVCFKSLRILLPVLPLSQRLHLSRNSALPLHAKSPLNLQFCKFFGFGDHV